MNGQNYIGEEEKLLIYIRRGRNTKAKRMLNEKLAKQCFDSGTLLHYSAMFGNGVIARELIRLKADVNQLDEHGVTPLMLAVEKSELECVKVLLEANANIDIVDSSGRTTLQIALELDCFESDIFEVLIGKVMNAEELAEKLIAAGCKMHHAAILGDVKLMECMLKRGVDINPGLLDITALQVAVEKDDVKLVRWLINNGAHVNAFDGDGSNALLGSAYRRNADIVTILLENGGDPNSKDRNDDYTPLFAVFMTSKTERKPLKCVELLLQHGAVPQNSSIINHTLFDFALDRSMNKEIKMLIGHLAMLEMQGKPVTQPFMYCNDPIYQSKHYEFHNYYDQCLQELKTHVFEKLSLLNLLTMHETKMKLLVRKKNFLPAVKKFLYSNNRLNGFNYYYSTLKKQVAKLRRTVRLEDEAVPVICKLFGSSYNHCYYLARLVIDYLDISDLENVSQV